MLSKWTYLCSHIIVKVAYVKLFFFNIFSFPTPCPDGNMNDSVAVLQHLCFSSLNLNLIGYRAFPLIGFLENKIGS